MNQFRKTILAVACTMCVVTSEAQLFRSSYFMETSNFRHQVNPALLENSYFGIPFLGNINVGATGNLSYSAFVYDYVNDSRSTERTLFMNPNISSSTFLGKLDEVNSADISLKTDIVSFAFPAFGGMNVLEMSFKSKTSIRIPYALFEFMKEPMQKESYHIKNLAVNSNNYTEIAFGHSHKIGDRLVIGVKPKLLVGLALVDLNIKNIDIEHTALSSSDLSQLYCHLEGYGRINLGGIASQFSYDEDRKRDPKTNRRRVDGFEFTGLKLRNYGLGIDFGVVVKAVDGLDLSLSVLDLGFLSYSTVQHATTSGSYTFDGFKEYEELMNSRDRDDIEDQFEALTNDVGVMFSLYDDGETKETQKLTAQLNFGAEYKMPFYDKLRVGLLHTRNLNEVFAYNQTMFMATVHPISVIEVGINCTASSTGTSAGVALGINAGPVCIHLGSDRLMLKYSEDGLPYKSLNTDANIGVSIKL